MENKKELIWKDTQTIESLSKQAKNIINILNDNYQKMKAIDNCLNYTTVIAATFFRYQNRQRCEEYKQERKELTDAITAAVKSQNSFASSEMIDNYISKDLVPKLYESEGFQTLRHDDDNDYIIDFVNFNSTKDKFEISNKFKDAIVEKNTYYIKNSTQAKKYKALQAVEQILINNDMTTQDLCHILYCDDKHIDIDYDLVKWLYQY